MRLLWKDKFIMQRKYLILKWASRQLLKNFLYKKWKSIFIYMHMITHIKIRRKAYFIKWHKYWTFLMLQGKMIHSWLHLQLRCSQLQNKEKIHCLFTDFCRWLADIEVRWSITMWTNVAMTMLKQIKVNADFHSFHDATQRKLFTCSKVTKKLQMHPENTWRFSSWEAVLKTMFRKNF